MANPTTNFGWVMPTATDLVTDLPADFNVFGQGVDTSMQYLLGGTTGQVLSKTSATNMAFTWTTPTDQVPLTTKGDLFTFTTVDARLGVGSNNQTLYADSTALTGLAWGASAKSTLTTTGDIIYASAANTPARLGIGTTGQSLVVAAGVPSWATPAAGGGMTLLATTTLTGASVTVSSLTGYKELCLVIRNARITSNGTFACTFNSDGTAKYTWNGLKAHDVNLTSATGAAAATSMTLGYIGDSATSTNLYGGEINIVAADQTSGVSVRSTGGFNDGTGNTAIFFNARYVNSAAISTFTLNAGASTWAAGTLMTYGVN